jgi:hypothetical protein
LLVEVGQIRDKVLDDVGVRQRVDARLGLGIRGNAAYTEVRLARVRDYGTLIEWGVHTQAGEGVDTVNVHRAGTTNTLTARSAESQGRVKFVLYPDESIEHHGSGLVEVEVVGLHLGLLAGLVGVPAVDLESLHLGILAGSRLNSRIGASEGRAEHRPRRREETRGGAEGGHGGRSEGEKTPGEEEMERRDSNELNRG